MRKQEFLDELKNKLSGLPRQDVDERLTFYSEMIDDRIEEGLSEEAAVSDIGSVDEIAEQIVADIPLSKIAKEKIKPKRRMRVWEIILLAIGSPIWLALLIAVIAVLIALYAVIWSVVASLWAVFASLIAVALVGITGGVLLAVFGNALSGVALIGASIVCAGLSILMFFGCRAATKGVAKLTKYSVLGIKKCFVSKEEA